LALDALLARFLELARDAPSANHIVAGPRASGEADFVAPHAWPSREAGDDAAQNARVEHAHGEDGGVTRGRGKRLVVVDGIEVARGAGVADEVRPGQRLDTDLRK